MRRPVSSHSCHYSPSPEGQPPQLHLWPNVVFLRTSIEGVTTTFFGRTIKRPERTHSHQDSDCHKESGMSQATSYDRECSQTSHASSAEPVAPNTTEAAGPVVEAPLHTTCQLIFWPAKSKPVKAHRSGNEKGENEEMEAKPTQRHSQDRTPPASAAPTYIQKTNEDLNSESGNLRLHLRGGDLEEDCCAGLFGGLCLSFACCQIFCPDSQ